MYGYVWLRLAKSIILPPYCPLEVDINPLYKQPITEGLALHGYQIIQHHPQNA